VRSSPSFPEIEHFLIYVEPRQNGRADCVNYRYNDRRGATSPRKGPMGWPWCTRAVTIDDGKWKKKREPGGEGCHRAGGGCNSPSVARDWDVYGDEVRFIVPPGVCPVSLALSLSLSRSLSLSLSLSLCLSLFLCFSVLVCNLCDVDIGLTCHRVCIWYLLSIIDAMERMIF